jgi:hypothetical protein
MWLKYMITPKIFSNKFRIVLVSEWDFIAEAILTFSSSCPCSESFLLRAGNMARKLFPACPPSEEHGYRSHLRRTWLGNNVSWLARLWRAWLGNNVLWFAQGFRSSNKHVTI